MGWPLRMFQEEGFYFVTSRCFQGRLLLRPCQAQMLLELREQYRAFVSALRQAAARWRRGDFSVPFPP
jgi:hypothetical protein